MKNPAFCACALGCVIAGASADVIYDRTDATDNQLIDESVVSTFIGGFFLLGEFFDTNAAEDFSLQEPHRITSVTGDFATLRGLVPAGGVLVEFFEDLGGVPAEIPAHAALSTDLEASDFVVPWNHNDLFGVRLKADLTDANLVLDPALWWVSITPVDETLDGDIYDVVRDNDRQTGHLLHGRNGGVDHANGYDGFYETDDWTLAGDLPFNELEGDIAIRIEGELVPAPASCALLAGFLLITRCRRRS